MNRSRIVRMGILVLFVVGGTVGVLKLPLVFSQEAAPAVVGAGGGAGAGLGAGVSPGPGPGAVPGVGVGAGVFDPASGPPEFPPLSEAGALPPGPSLAGGSGESPPAVPANVGLAASAPILDAGAAGGPAGLSAPKLPEQSSGYIAPVAVPFPGIPGSAGPGAGGPIGMMAPGMMGPMVRPENAEMALARAAKAALSRYARESDLVLKEKIKSELRSVLQEQFRLQHLRREAELVKIEQRLAEIRAKLKKREAAQGTIVERRLEQLIYDADGLGWSIEDVPDSFFNEMRSSGMPAGMPAAMGMSGMGMMPVSSSGADGGAGGGIPGTPPLGTRPAGAGTRTTPRSGTSAGAPGTLD